MDDRLRANMPHEKLRAQFNMVNFTTVGDRVKFLRERAGISMAELARKTGLTRSSIHQLEHGYTHAPKPENLFHIAETLNGNARWLATGEGVPDLVRGITVAEAGGPETALLNQVRLEFDINGIHAWIKTGADPVPMPRSFLTRLGVDPENAVVVGAQDDTMAPVIMRGDRLIVDVSDTRARNGKVFAVSLGADLLVRRLFIDLDGGVTLTAENEAKSRPMKVPPEHIGKTVRILGRVRFRAGEGDF